jgi:hypothetical protein
MSRYSYSGAVWTLLIVAAIREGLGQDCWTALAVAGVFALLAIAQAVSKASEVDREVL